MKNSHFFILVVILFYGCANNSKLSSSFGIRKYIKGHFWNLPATVAPAAAITKNTAQPKTSVVNNIAKESTTLPKTDKTHTTLVKLAPGYTHVGIKSRTEKLEKAVNKNETAVSTHSVSPTDDTPEDSGSNKSVTGFIYVVIGGVLIGLAILLGIYATQLIFSGLAILAIFIWILLIVVGIAGAIFYIAGIIDCIRGLINKEAPRGLAIAGLALIAGVALIGLIIGILEAQ